MRLPALLLTVPFCFACTKPEVITAPFSDAFDRPELGTAYFNTGGPYELRDGKLAVKGAYNHPLWLKKQLPRDAVIEFDVTSKSRDGDIKVEAWGDGRTHATDKGAYLASSYVFVFGGWGNTISALCRLDEHGADRKTRSDVKVETGRTYRWKIQRKGQKVEWFVDGKPFLSMDDPVPLEGERHAHLGFNNWESELQFDNLKISPW
ncbi:MAG: hypothetical protein IT371_19145 [Deltaproteobacteria bacterium]|nr:hypothetical protein [Deltaproteobacteria bacterium]